VGRFKTAEERTAKKLKRTPQVLQEAKETANAAPVEPVKELTEEEKKLKKDGSLEERQRLLKKIFDKKEIMSAEYKVLIAHTGSLVASSMTVAYSRAINDIIKLIFEEYQNEKSVQEKN